MDIIKFPPVESQTPNTNYKPAFQRQKRVAGVKTQTAYVVEKINGDLKRPWAIVPIPDGRLLITEKSGYLQIHDANGKMLKKITVFPEVDDRDQGGMLDVALDPDFKNNKIIKWSFSEKYKKRQPDVGSQRKT